MLPYCTHLLVYLQTKPKYPPTVQHNIVWEVGNKRVGKGCMACDISCDFVVVIALGDAKKVHICEQRCVVPRRVVFVVVVCRYIHTCGINPGIPATKVCTSVSVKGGAVTTRWRLTVAPQYDVSTI